MISKRLIVLGSGPAGYTAAIYAARANLKPLLITGVQEGGQLMTTTSVDNWPGGRVDLQGPELMRDLQMHAQRLSVEIVCDHIHDVNLNQATFVLHGQKQYGCDALIVATGASARYLGLPSEKAFMGKGVSACATCDGFFYRQKKVVVVGGGNTAVEEALYLSHLAEHVTLIHRRSELRAEKMLSEQLMAQKNVSILWNSVLESVVGDERGVSGVRIQDVQTQAHHTLDVAGVFIAIGHTPNTQIFHNQLEMDASGYLKVQAYGAATATSVSGVFAAGDVSDPIYRQAITSAGSGCMAALDAEKYLACLTQGDYNVPIHS